jgi:hypothetical protein
MSDLQSAFIYLDSIGDWVSIIGACLEDGQFRLIWKASSNQLGTIDLTTVQELSAQAVPF